MDQVDVIAERIASLDAYAVAMVRERAELCAVLRRARIAARVPVYRRSDSDAVIARFVSELGPYGRELAVLLLRQPFHLPPGAQNDRHP